MKKLFLILALCLPGALLLAQVNGDLQYFGDKAILQVWGSHYERGVAQGYLTAAGALNVFDQFYYAMFALSNADNYNYLLNYYLEHFDVDSRFQSEAQGMIAGMQQSGADIFHSGLQRNLDANDLMLANAFLDMNFLRRAFTDQDLRLGCASLSSWGVATQQDSLLAGASVLTRWLDWTPLEVLISQPLLVVHHPSEPDEQKWMGFGVPGFLGALTAISESGTWASLNLGNYHDASNYDGLDPVMFDLRRGVERLDYDSSGSPDALDLFASISGGTHLSGSIIHAMTENSALTLHAVIETNNSGTVMRYPADNGNLPDGHLAATNHFRLLTFPTCCTRYANIVDSLTQNPHLTAKRQWRVLAGAAGREDNLTALQFTPSTGAILWASATTGEPAYQRPAITLDANELFSYSVSAEDELAPPLSASLLCHPNPLRAGKALNIRSGRPLRQLRVYNLRGQLVLSRELQARRGTLTLDLPGLSSGIYLLRAVAEDGSWQNARIVLLKD
ncbi:MAG TPA: T9SS type A sorting domain-containing protein [Candidatus Cloacimonadota bacterium]|jgi:hypothetical protein|nr:T9SS type A sorting domain-containing protein [Candidatus Cloacimonadota bacterium]HOG30571.1 T9SS type A sorting domain-containing protein [Candidatus Cloacimonadota bacterium]HOR58849.1 T9SS type A sorting domain-containing protein [Candidatus Cloacimonadota bacterium]HPB08313.1 T9SS type A sorting domain-containing protein [Candidatus Cloacimonadota bacterium]HPL23574.1 T9SS type A sorting domain-containing protein [Candidatus Cloacimonadota bacterium]